MKAFSDSAHPTTLDGTPVTYQLAKEIIGTTQLRDGHEDPDRSILANTIEPANKALEALNRIRDSRNDRQPLQNNT